MSLIEVDNVSKTFWRHRGRKLLRHTIADLFRARGDEHYFYALRDITFQVNKGESVALVGANGAGKSTMLSVVTGLARPTTGTVRVNGRVAALLELGSGFHPDLSGRENVFVNAALLGLSEQETQDRFDAIVDFSGVREFIDQPTRTYSSGMLVRLAFAVAVHVNPAILIVDEVLAVGDAEFQDKCLRKIAEMRANGTTMLCVTHSAKTVLQLCDRAIWLDHGRMILDGSSSWVMKAYTDYTENPQKGLPHLARQQADTRQSAVR